MRREGKKSNIFITLIIALAVIAVCIFFKIQVRDIKADNIKSQKIIEELNHKIETEKDRTKELEEYSKYVKTKQFVELMARNKLGLVYPNEIIFKNDN